MRVSSATDLGVKLARKVCHLGKIEQAEEEEEEEQCREREEEEKVSRAVQCRERERKKSRGEVFRTCRDLSRT